MYQNNIAAQLNASPLGACGDQRQESMSDLLASLHQEAELLLAHTVSIANSVIGQSEQKGSLPTPAGSSLVDSLRDLRRKLCDATAHTIRTRDILG